jgi:hypothetical protein
MSDQTPEAPTDPVSQLIALLQAQQAAAAPAPVAVVEPPVSAPALDPTIVDAVPAPPAVAPVAPVAASSSPAPSFDVGELVEFQTTDTHTGNTIRGVGLVRGHQDGEPGTIVTDPNGNETRRGYVKAGVLVIPLSSDVLVLDDDEILN